MVNTLKTLSSGEAVRHRFSLSPSVLFNDQVSSFLGERGGRPLDSFGVVGQDATIVSSCFGDGAVTLCHTFGQGASHPLPLKCATERLHT